MLAESIRIKSLKRLRVLLILSCILTGLLAGSNVDRYLIQVPAWNHLSILSWAAFIRQADLSINGMIIYPAEAIISTILLIAACVIIMKNGTEFFPSATLLFVSTCFALAGLGLTIFAAPYLLSLRSLPDDPELLQLHYNNFHFWGAWRAIMQILSFLFCAFAIGKVFRSKE
jgi:hypothetical protein